MNFSSRFTWQSGRKEGERRERERGRGDLYNVGPTSSYHCEATARQGSRKLCATPTLHKRSRNPSCKLFPADFYASAGITVSRFQKKSGEFRAVFGKIVMDFVGCIIYKVVFVLKKSWNSLSNGFWRWCNDAMDSINEMDFFLDTWEEKNVVLNVYFNMVVCLSIDRSFEE